MKRILLLLIFALSFGTLSAQDIILKKNADEIQANVLKVSDTEVTYKKWENPDGPIYSIAKNEIFIIKYKNGSKDVIYDYTTRTRPEITGKFPKYQGEIAAAFGLGIEDVNGALIETVHGMRLNPYLFTGLGVGFNYYDGIGLITPAFNVKGYYPATPKIALYLSLDLGAGIGVADWAGVSDFYTSIGPGIHFGPPKGSVRGDFSIRFQHMGNEINALLFRIGIGF